MEDGAALPEPSIEVRCYFVRGRNALVARSDFSPLYTDYYLHRMDEAIHYEPEEDELLKQTLAAFTLHLASRPWHDVTAWTLNLRDPLLNIFVTGNSLLQRVTGRLFKEEVRKPEESILYAQVNNKRSGPRESMLPIEESAGMFAAAESYYRRSEQRPGRYFQYADEDFVLVTAQPDCDTAWLRRLDEEAIRQLDQDEELSLLEKRFYRFDCGCSLDRVMPAVAPLARQDMDALFDEREVLDITCPRCAARYRLTREAMEFYLSAS